VDNWTGDRLLHWFRCLRIRLAIRHEIHEAFTAHSRHHLLAALVRRSFASTS
jgi:hypothetical protein